MLSIAFGELIQLFRNRLVLVTSLLLPVGLSAFFIAQHETFEQLGSLGYIAVLVLFFVSAFGLYTGTVTTLASRRQNLFLKRLRSTAASDTGIMAGLLIPISVIALIQVVAILTVLAIVTGAPADPIAVALAVVLTLLMMLGLGLATAGLTNSPEHAQVTTLPISIFTIGVSSWIGITGTESLAAVKQILPGGAVTEILINGWNGGVALKDSLFLLAPSVAWVAVSITLAKQYFRWEPRR